MSKIISLVLVFIVGCKFATGRWPWEIWRVVRVEEPAVRRARQLLGVNASASRAEIIEAHKRLITRVHPDRGGTEDLVHEANAARDLMLAAMVMRDGRTG
ncbi:MAG: molecular chaperone DnaJ [Sphingomonadales bacterium]|nr:molecular chaperone DnaJ [Sphingomonadales bacterium]MDE2172118.1 molecular chaperone DnaJ [Sphingomonadales bacterium]